MIASSVMYMNSLKKSSLGAFRYGFEERANTRALPSERRRSRLNYLRSLHIRIHVRYPTSESFFRKTSGVARRGPRGGKRDDDPGAPTSFFTRFSRCSKVFRSLQHWNTTNKALDFLVSAFGREPLFFVERGSFERFNLAHTDCIPR